MVDDIPEQMVALLPRLRRFAYTLCGTPDVSDDLVQAACERALARLNQFQPGTRLDSWMFRIIYTIWLDQVRADRRRNTIADSDALMLVAHDARIEQQAEARDALAIVRREIAELPEEQRAVLGLVSVDGLSYMEAAITLGIPIGTVMSRLARARKRLMNSLEGPISPQEKLGRPA